MGGVFTLEHSISAQCFIHWGGAVLFMAGAMNHAKASNELYEGVVSRGEPFLQSRFVKVALWLRNAILKYSSVGMFMVPLLMQVFPAATEEAPQEHAAASEVGADFVQSKETPMDPRMMNAMGLMQWGIILQF